MVTTTERLLCKCGESMHWIRRQASTIFYQCFKCNRKVEEDHNGTLTWWAIESIEPMEGES